MTTTRTAAGLLAFLLLLTACGSDGADDATGETSALGPSNQVTVEGGDQGAVGQGTDDEMTDDEMTEEEMTEAEMAEEEMADTDAGAAVESTVPGEDPSFDPAPEPSPDQPTIDGFTDARIDALSTFALDVDTASFTQTLSWLEAGQRPPAGVVRPEEFVNWPEHGYPEPADGWSITTDGLLSSPWSEDHALLRVGLATPSISPEARPPVTLVFVVDTSGSMSGQPLQTVKDTLLLLVDQLRSDDRIGLVEYGTTARLLLRPTPLSESSEVVDAIAALRTDGSTNAEEGLALGYQVATDALRPGDATSVVLASDGVANVGATGPEAILRTIGEGTDLGIQLLALGVSEQSYNDHLMEQLANRGNGSTFYVRDERDAERLFVDRLEETLIVAARESKVQVEVDPELVPAYRLIGYENRAVADEDFRNDEIDAGEVGAGHEVTAVYELELAPGVTGRDVLGVVTIRWEDPTTGLVDEVDELVTGATLTSTPAPGLATAIAAVGLAEVLRGSPHVAWSTDELAAWAVSLEAAGLDETLGEAIRLAVVARPAPGA